MGIKIRKRLCRVSSFKHYLIFELRCKIYFYCFLNVLFIILSFFYFGMEKSVRIDLCQGDATGRQIEKVFQVSDEMLFVAFLCVCFYFMSFYIFAKML